MKRPVTEPGLQADSPTIHRSDLERSQTRQWGPCVKSLALFSRKGLFAYGPQTPKPIADVKKLLTSWIGVSLAGE